MSRCRFIEARRGHYHVRRLCLLMHADRGGQYGGSAYRQLLHDHQA